MKRLKRNITIPIKDKLCLVGCAWLVLLAGVLDTAMVEANSRAVLEQAEAPASVTITQKERLSPLSETPVVVEIESVDTPEYLANVPLDRGLKTAILDACEENGVPVSIALAVIEVESNFDPEADNGLCVGLMQLNTKYYPKEMTPEENIAAGVAHLAGQIERYGVDIPAALRSYNRGYDDGDRTYAYTVLAAAEKWENAD